MQRQNYQSVKLLDKQHLLENYVMVETKDVSDSFRSSWLSLALPENYSVVKTSFKHATQDRVWGSSLISVYNNGELVCEWVRNYPSFAGIYAQQNDKEFIITSEDYQCITIVNLTDKEVKSYVDVDDVKHGCGFCPISFDWDDDTLYVEGCIWACPYETMICRDIDLLSPEAAFNSADWEDDCDDYEEEDDDWDDDDSDCYCE